MIEKLTKINENIYRWESSFSIGGLSLVVFLIFSSSLLRWFNSPLQWMLDLAQLLFAWVVFIGADLALKMGRHNGVEIFEQLLPTKSRTYLNILWNVLILSFLIICIFFGFFLVLENTQRRFNGLPIARSWMVLSVPFGFSFMTRTVLETLIRQIKSLKKTC